MKGKKNFVKKTVSLLLTAVLLFETAQTETLVSYAAEELNEMGLTGSSAFDEELPVDNLPDTGGVVRK